MLRKILFGTTFVVILAVARGAGADTNSGRTTAVDVSGSFYRLLVTQFPSESWTFTTSNLSAGGDTVIHVQNYDDPQGGYIAGNDDVSVGVLSSQVVVPAVGATRNLLVIVRSYGTSSQGTCDLTATSSSSGSSFYPGIAFGGAAYYIGDLIQGAHVTIVERQGGARDTTVLTVGGPGSHNPAHAVAYDDDDGVDFMSFVHNNESCTFCLVVIANYGSGTPTASADLVWDGDADTTDYDADGLGASLEHVICEGSTCLNDSVADTDQDGHSDGDEILGEERSWPPVKLPAWGADPLQKDIFYEIDWQQCTQAACNGNLDLGQLGDPLDPQITNGLVAQVNSELSPVRVHMDIGRTNTDPSTWTMWGAWGGATRIDYANPPGGDKDGGDTDGCPTDPYGNYFASSERMYMFHFGTSFGLGGGHVWHVPGGCFVLENYARTITHETGHMLGLLHGGRPGKIAMNYKPQYRSMMDYLYNWDTFIYSHGNSPVVSLNPTALNETTGLGATDQLVLTKLRDNWCPGGTCVNLTTGAVDWNRDGTISPSGTTVQGAITEWDFSQNARSEFQDKLNDPAMTWVSVGGVVGDQLWVFGRSYPGSVLQYARVAKTTLNTGCGSFTSLYDEAANIDCAGFGGTTTDFPGSKILSVAPGAAEYDRGILVVSQRTTGTITSNLITINSSTGQITYGADVVLPGGITATQDIAALSTGTGVVTAWAPGGNPYRLKQWTYQNGAWTGPVDQQWSDQTNINPIWGIAATRGYQDGSSTAQTYAAIATNPNGTIEFAQKSAVNGRWTKLSTSWSIIGSQPAARARPGLAYQKRAGQANSVGRFYMAFNQQPGSCTGWYGDPSNCEALLLMTEGNLAAGSPTNKRLKWIKPSRFTDGGLPGGTPLVDDPTRDINLRGLSIHPWVDQYSNSHRTVWFGPVADGIVNASMSDMDDYPYITGALRAALSLDDCTPGNNCGWPGGILPPSLP